MFIYRVFPYLPGAKPGQPGSVSYIHPDQGAGRWDNPQLYRAMYVAADSVGAIGETFGHITNWTSAMLINPSLPGARRSLGVYRFDEERWPLLDLDDPKVLVQRSIRPSEVVMRNRPRSQALARDIFLDEKWSGISWWSIHRPQWVLHVLFDTRNVGSVSTASRSTDQPALHGERTGDLFETGICEPVDVLDLQGHPALFEAAERLAKPVDASLK